MRRGGVGFGRCRFCYMVGGIKLTSGIGMSKTTLKMVRLYLAGILVTFVFQCVLEVGQSWLSLSEQLFRFDKWSACRVQAAAICGSQLK